MISGLVLIDKPSGPTSHDCVAWARKILKTKQIGHTGTLDPLASGLMILVLGEATKLSNYITESDKTYEVLIEFGKSSDTLDRTGRVIAQGVIPSFESIQNIFSNLKGLLKLKVPSYSAIKVDGKTLMERARKNEDVPTVLREMNFYHVELLSYEKPFAKVILNCSKGSYVRSWVEALADQLGTFAIVSELRRIENSGHFVKSAIPIEKLMDSEKLLKGFIPLKEALPQWERVFVPESELFRVKNGLFPNSLIPKASQLKSNMFFLQSESSGNLLGIVENSSGSFKIKRLFTY